MNFLFSFRSNWRSNLVAIGSAGQFCCGCCGAFFFVCMRVWCACICGFVELSSRLTVAVGKQYGALALPPIFCLRVNCSCSQFNSCATPNSSKSHRFGCCCCCCNFRLFVGSRILASEFLHGLEGAWYHMWSHWTTRLIRDSCSEIYQHFVCLLYALEIELNFFITFLFSFYFADKNEIGYCINVPCGSHQLRRSQSWKTFGAGGMRTEVKSRRYADHALQRHINRWHPIRFKVSS